MQRRRIQTRVAPCSCCQLARNAKSAGDAVGNAARRRSRELPLARLRPSLVSLFLDRHDDCTMWLVHSLRVRAAGSTATRWKEKRTLAREGRERCAIDGATVLERKREKRYNRKGKMEDHRADPALLSFLLFFFLVG